MKSWIMPMLWAAFVSILLLWFRLMHRLRFRQIAIARLGNARVYTGILPK